ncbi:MAG: flippase-like domain-containing protein [Mitsuaria chitosanitabida]|uniref:lysylphosphatidylglycerol synthase transmembrane domain-containing protein n=1 Tax=Roseateles chitosanitabidus TaxID=65048 RepID=UPI001B1E88E2|nr:lysylphosphatidylglycerol synthase transmembrane domain-containing protein [Roseateles chitosanitabidus]MBO9688674.1 flippase-like domain-containing protein [Roseateles chitosanitabidus]
MRVNRALAGFLMLTAVYVVLLLWLDLRRRVFEGLPLLLDVLPVLVGLSLVSYVVRFLRWRWLLSRAGCPTPAGRGLLAYLAGFAFTATPGKVGELVRVRYFEPMGVPAWRVVSVFVYERALDLVVILGFAAMSFDEPRLAAAVVIFVVICLGLVFWCGRHPELLGTPARALDRRGWTRVAKWMAVLRDGLVGSRVWLRSPDLAVGALLGGVAWGCTAWGFLYLLDQLGITGLTVRTGLGVYPLSMLAGAASMLPGGIGSTEVTIVGLLTVQGAELGVAMLAAICIRLSTLWFAIFCGLLAVVVLEAHPAPPAVREITNSSAIGPRRQ